MGELLDARSPSTSLIFWRYLGLFGSGSFHLLLLAAFGTGRFLFCFFF